MFNRIFSLWLVGCTHILMTGCGGVSVSFGNFGDFTNDEIQDLPFQEVVPRVTSAISDRRLVVVRDISSWDTLWREHTAGILPPPPLPGVNFARNMVIGVFLGTHFNACHDVEVISITQHSNPGRITVDFRETALLPGPNCPSGNSNPATLVVVPYSSLPVEFFQSG